MTAKRILVLGGGFAGLWSAMGAARKLDEIGVGSDEVEVTLVNRDAYHSIRVRNYEADLTPTRVPLDDVLKPVGVRRIEGDVVDLDLAAQHVTIESGKESVCCPYDRMVFALGSRVVRPNIPGLAEFAFDVDTFGGAAKLDEHLRSLSAHSQSPSRLTAIVVGAGLTGIETACELTSRLSEAKSRANLDDTVRVMLVDHSPHVGSDMGDSARPVIEEALIALGVETKLGVQVAAVDASGVTLATGETIPAATVVWCAGMRAHPLTEKFPVERDRLGRLPVDEFMRVRNVNNVFAAGDAAWCMVDPQHASVMSCQHGRPMGRFAGNNVVCDLLGLSMLPLQIDWYVTVLDLGAWGAVYTEGWDRRVVSTGATAKKTKQLINCRRIYPPLNGDRAEILAAAAPVIQPPPPNYR